MTVRDAWPRRVSTAYWPGPPLLRGRVALAVLLLWLLPVVTLAQQAPEGTPLRLSELQQAATDADPRMQQLHLLEAQSWLRLTNVSRQWYPVTSLESLAQYQTDAPTTPVLATGGRLFAAPRDNYDAYARVDQRLFDPAIAAQAAIERAQLAESQARVRTAVYALRQQVNDAFFAAAALQRRLDVLAATIAELQGRLRESEARVQQGTALPSDRAAIEATLLQRQQDEDELRAGVRAALARLSAIIGHPIAPDAVPVIPDVGAQLAALGGRLQSVRSRPEYEQFARTRERIARQRDITATQTMPRVSAFGRVGYGRPALDFVENRWQAYGVGGVRLQWTAWNWGTTRREREAQALQEQIVAADEATFAKTIDTQIQADLATLDHLARALAADQRIIELRTEVERTARVRLQEGVLTSSDYLSRDTELLQARIAQAAHEVELAQAQVRLLTTLGVEVR